MMSFLSNTLSARKPIGLAILVAAPFVMAVLSGIARADHPQPAPIGGLHAVSAGLAPRQPAGPSLQAVSRPLPIGSTAPGQLSDRDSDSSADDSDAEALALRGPTRTAGTKSLLPRRLAERIALKVIASFAQSSGTHAVAMALPATSRSASESVVLLRRLRL